MGEKVTMARFRDSNVGLLLLLMVGIFKDVCNNVSHLTNTSHLASPHVKTWAPDFPPCASELVTTSINMFLKSFESGWKMQQPVSYSLEDLFLDP